MPTAISHMGNVLTCTLLHSSVKKLAEWWLTAAWDRLQLC